MIRLHAGMDDDDDPMSIIRSTDLDNQRAQKRITATNFRFLLYTRLYTYDITTLAILFFSCPFSCYGMTRYPLLFILAFQHDIFRN